MGELADRTRWMDATEQAALVANGEVTALELLDAAIERIEALDGPLNAVNIRWFDKARQAAGEPMSGPFAGVPFLLKDLHAHMAGVPLTNGNRVLRHEMPISDHDTTLVSRFRAAGLNIAGRTTSPEMGTVPVTESLAWGPTRNPWDTDRTPGGSSGGAAAAVAAGMVPMAHASDGGGSIRIPAACCGLVGLKPTQGRITMGPNRHENGLGVELAVTRTVRDTAGLLAAVAGPGVGDSVIAPEPPVGFVDALHRDPGRLRIGMLAGHPRGGEIDPDCAEAALRTGRALEELGHDVVDAFPDVLADPSATKDFMAVWSANAAMGIAEFGRMLGRPLTDDEVEPGNRALAAFAAVQTAQDYAAALAAMGAYRRRCLQWWADGFDLLLTPTLAEVPVLIGEHDERPGDDLWPMKRAQEWVVFTPAFNVTGQPAISLPMHQTSGGLPVGAQLVAATGREDLLISVAAQLEAAVGWPHL